MAKVDQNPSSNSPKKAIAEETRTRISTPPPSGRQALGAAATVLMAGACNNPPHADAMSAVGQAPFSYDSGAPGRSAEDASTKDASTDRKDASLEKLPHVSVTLGVPETLDMSEMRLICVSEDGREIACSQSNSKISFNVPMGKKLEYAIFDRSGGERICGFILQANSSSSGSYALECLDGNEVITVSE